MRRGRLRVWGLALAASACGSRSGLVGPGVRGAGDGDADLDADGDADANSDADADSDSDADADADADAATCPGSLGWRSETVVAYGDRARIAVGEGGSVHVLYRQRRRAEDVHGVGYATNAGGTWATVTLETDVSWRGGAVAIGTQGEPLVSYATRGLTGGEVVFSRGSRDEWQRDVLISSPLASFTLVDIVVGAEGPEVAFLDHGRIQVAQEVGKHWSLSEVPTRTLGGRPCASIALDSRGAAHVLGELDESVGHWVRAEGDDRWTLLASMEHAAFRCSIVADGEDRVHALYEQGGEAYHAVLDGEAWEEESTGVHPFLLSVLALDSEGSLHFVFTDQDDPGRGLVHAQGREGDWQLDVIDPNGGDEPHLALAEGEIHVVYATYDPDSDADGPKLDVVHATRCLE